MIPQQLHYMPLIAPITLFISIIVILALIHLMNLLDVSFQSTYQQKQNILVLIGIYSILVLIIIKIYTYIIKHQMIVTKFSGRSSVQELQKSIKLSTKISLQKLKQTQQFKNWEAKKIKNIVYQMIEESSQEQYVINPHRLATAKKIF